ncbi:MAG: hypothetical protein KAW46_06145, partial [candidate division Zixibacteria bacterium]|nr:hypothetical protein [candidate division Zixibacteria bacterium]
MPGNRRPRSATDVDICQPQSFFALRVQCHYAEVDIPEPPSLGQTFIEMIFGKRMPFRAFASAKTPS